MSLLKLKTKTEPLHKTKNIMNYDNNVKNDTFLPLTINDIVLMKNINPNAAASNPRNNKNYPNKKKYKPIF